MGGFCELSGLGNEGAWVANGWRFVFVVRCSDLGNEGAWVANEWRFRFIIRCSNLEQVLLSRSCSG